MHWLIERRTASNLQWQLRPDASFPPRGPHATADPVAHGPVEQCAAEDYGSEAPAEEGVDWGGRGPGEKGADAAGEIEGEQGEIQSRDSRDD